MKSTKKGVTECTEHLLGYEFCNCSKCIKKREERNNMVKNGL
jgi:hypothetical protein